MTKNEFELNRKLASLLGIGWHLSPEKSPAGHTWIFQKAHSKDDCENELINYCADLNQLEPMMVKYRIAVQPSAEARDSHLEWHAWLDDVEYGEILVKAPKIGEAVVMLLIEVMERDNQA